MRSIVFPVILLGACFLKTHFAIGQWTPGEAYDVNQEKYNTRVLWQTDQAIFSDIRFNEYRGYHHILASYNNNT
jgi:hypothetical protein